MQNFVKIAGVVNHELWQGQQCEPVPHMPVHRGGSPWVVVVAQKVDGLAVLSGNSTQISPAAAFVQATFGQPLAKFLGGVLAAWHDGACQNSQFVVQQVKEPDTVVKTIHEEHAVLVGDLRILHKTVDYTGSGSKEEALDVPSDHLSVGTP